MRSLLPLLILGCPALALAQPSEPPPPPPGDGTGQPAGTPPPYNPGTPAGPYAGPTNGGPAYGPGQNTAPYGQQPQPYMQQEAPNLKSGMTFELNLGIGWIRAANDSDSETSDLGIGGLNLGVGGWVNPKLAISGRIAGVTYSEDGASLTQGFLGVSAQYWIDDHFWAGGGVGFGIIRVDIDGFGDDSKGGFGLDGRVGYSFMTTSENTFNVSLELTPGFFSENDQSFTYTGIAFLLGYQHL